MYGMQTRVGIAAQDSGGSVAVTDSAAWLAVTNESFKETIAQVVDPGMRGVLDQGDHYAGPRTVAGDLAMPVHPIDLGFLLKAAGFNRTTTAAGSAYSHEWLPITSDWDSKWPVQPHTVFIYRDTGSAFEYYDMQLNQLELSISAGELLQAKASFVGGAFAQIAAVAASYNTGKRFSWDQMSWAIGTSAQAYWQELALTFDNQIETLVTLNGSYYPTEAGRKDFRKITGSGKLLFNDQAELQQWLSQAERQALAQWTGNVEVASGYYDSVLLDIPKLRYTDFDAAAGGPGKIMASVAFDAVYDTTSSYALRIVQVNTLASY